jgi:hypothetical protein
MTFTSVLKCHLETPTRAVIGIEVTVGLTQAGEIALSYILRGELDRFLIPTPRTPCRRDGLWRHTCFESFIAVENSAAYLEFNFSPSGEWAAYAFRGYRDGGPIESDALDPQIVVRREAETLELSALIRLDRLSAIPSGATIRLGVSAVVEELDGSVSYWALKHPPGKPDFHHPDNFILEIKPPIVAGSDAIAYTGKP